MDLARLWSRDPDWFYQQDRNTQTQLLGWWRVHRNPAGNPRRGSTTAATPARLRDQVQTTSTGRSFWMGG